jgi:hypothetical protein
MQETYVANTEIMSSSTIEAVDRYINKHGSIDRDKTKEFVELASNREMSIYVVGVLVNLALFLLFMVLTISLFYGLKSRE